MKLSSPKIKNVFLARPGKEKFLKLLSTFFVC